MEHIRISKLNTDLKSVFEISSSKVRGMQAIIFFYFRAHSVGVKMIFSLMFDILRMQIQFPILRSNLYLVLDKEHILIRKPRDS